MLKIFSKRVIVLIAVALFLFPLIYSNIKNISSSIITGVIKQTKPKPLYGFARTSVNPQINAKDITFAADFSYVYYSAKNFRKMDIYSNQFNFDKGINNKKTGRSYYSPFLFTLYEQTFCRLPLPCNKAALLHLSFQILLLLITTYFILAYYCLRIIMIPITLIYGVLIFLTPLGISWFERGQFELYSAVALLLFMFAIYESNEYVFALSALFASLKWVILPFFVMAWILYLCCGQSRQRFLFFIIFVWVFLLTFAVSSEFIPKFLNSLFQSQLQCNEGDLGLAKRFPPNTILIMLCMGTLLFLGSLVRKRIENRFLSFFLPYATGLAVLSILLPSINYQYRVMSLIGFIPMVYVWLVKFAKDHLYQKEFISFFIVFIFVAFHGFWFISEKTPNGLYFIATYIAYFLAILIITIPRLFLKEET